MSASSVIKADIIDKLSALPSMNKVYGWEKPNPAGFPCAFVTFAGAENEFFTTAENKRIFAFRVLILVFLGQDRNSTNQQELAEQTIQDLLGEAIDALDSDITLGENAQTLFVEAAVGDPGYVEFEGGWARSAELNLRVHSIYTV